MIFVLMLEILSLNIISGEECEDILCSNVNDYVCGVVKSGGSITVTKYQNICHLEKTRCLLKGNADIIIVPDDLCGFKKDIRNSRRVTDFSIVGAYQVCNHTCPTYCIDTYDPACARIWDRERVRSSYKVMINHCHIDLFSCVVGVNVTIYPLTKCISNGNALIFMKQVAALKTLKLVSRRSNDAKNTEWITRYGLDKTLENEMSEEQEEVKLPLLISKITGILRFK